MWTDLLPELLHDILLKLPVKSLIKCTALSKYHRSRITSPEFINAHIKHNTTTTTHLALRYKPHEHGREKFMFELDDQNFSGFNVEGALELPFLCDPWFNVLGSINGVICLATDLYWGGEEYILWNPSIRKYFELPTPLYDYDDYYDPDDEGCEVVSGFMFDPLTEDYRVVRVVNGGNNSGDLDRRHVEVYSTKSGVWRDLGPFDVDCAFRIFASGCYNSCFLHSHVNWLVGKKNGPVIMKFSMYCEKFEHMEIPSCFTQEDQYNYEMQEIGGMLGLISQFDTCCVWVMKEYGVVGSWTKILDLDFLNHYGYVAFEIRKNEEILMVKGREYEKDNHTVITFDPTNGAERTMGEISGQSCSFNLFTYVESMVFFGEWKDKVARRSKRKKTELTP